MENQKLDAIYTLLRETREEVAVIRTKVESLNVKVGIQNGRIWKLEEHRNKLWGAMALVLAAIPIILYFLKSRSG